MARMPGGHGLLNILIQALKSILNWLDPNLIVAGHGYSTTDASIAPFEQAEKHNLHIWQTEISDDKDRKETWPDAMKWAKTFHSYMANGNVSGFVWWAGARPCSSTGENLIQLEEALPSTTYYRVPRYYTFGQYTKYIEPDAVMCGCRSCFFRGRQASGRVIGFCLYKRRYLYHRAGQRF